MLFPCASLPHHRALHNPNGHQRHKCGVGILGLLAKLMSVEWGNIVKRRVMTANQIKEIWVMNDAQILLKAWRKWTVVGWVVILPCITDFPKSKIGNINFLGLVVSGSVRFDLSLIKITHFLHYISRFFCGIIDIHSDNIALIHPLRPPFVKFCPAASVVQSQSSYRWQARPVQECPLLVWMGIAVWTISQNDNISPCRLLWLFVFVCISLH